MKEQLEKLFDENASVGLNVIPKMDKETFVAVVNKLINVELATIAMRWKGNREIEFEKVANENIIKLIHDSIDIFIPRN